MKTRYYQSRLGRRTVYAAVRDGVLAKVCPDLEDAYLHTAAKLGAAL